MLQVVGISVGCRFPNESGGECQAQETWDVVPHSPRVVERSYCCYEGAQPTPGKVLGSAHVEGDSYW